MKTPLETEEQQKLIQWLRIKKLMYWATPNGAVLKGSKLQRVKQMSKLKKEGLVNGVSDVIVMLPNKILFIEMKRQKKKLTTGKMSSTSISVSDEQKSFLKKVNGFDYAHGIIAYGFNEAMEFIEKEIVER